MAVVFKGDLKAFFADIRPTMNKATETLEALYCRWQDEKAYEDINDYQKALQKALPDMAIAKMTKRPFGCLIHIPGHPLPMFFRVKGGAIKWGFER